MRLQQQQSGPNKLCSSEGLIQRDHLETILDPWRSSDQEPYGTTASLASAGEALSLEPSLERSHVPHPQPVTEARGVRLRMEARLDGPIFLIPWPDP